MRPEKINRLMRLCGYTRLILSTHTHTQYIYTDDTFQARDFTRSVYSNNLDGLINARKKQGVK